MNRKLKYHALLTLLGVTFTTEIPAQLPNAWQINDNLTTFGVIEYITNLTAAKVSAASANGWRYEIVSRMGGDFDSAAAQSMAFGDGTRRFYIFFDRNVNGQLTAQLLGGATYVLSYAANYYAHEMTYDPVTSNATYRLNGVVIALWPGQLSTGQSNQVMWGANSSSGRGAMNYHRATFEIVGQGTVASYDAGLEGNPAVAPSPTNQAWTRFTSGAAISEGPVSPDIFEFSRRWPNAWQISDSSFFGGSTLTYLTNVTEAQKIAATNSGWRFTVVSRLVSDYGSNGAISFIFGDGARRYGVVWDFNASGQLIGSLFGGPVITLTDFAAAKKYHVHQLTYNPATGNATYSLDGTALSPWPGEATTAQSNIVQWGSASSLDRSDMYFHQAHFEIIGQGAIASYNAGMAANPTVAPDPTTQGWTRNPTSPTISEGPISSDNMPLPPLVTTLAAVGAAPNSAELRARLLSDGRATDYWFEYGATTNYGSLTSTNTVPSGNFAVFVTNTISFLPQTAYHFRVVATDGFVTEVGSNMSFSTPAYVTTLAATQIHPTSALLNATVRPGGLDTVCYFEYGTTTNYGNTSAISLIPQDISTTNIGVIIRGLLPEMTYHFRAAVSNSAGIAVGTNLSFITPAYVTTLAATLIQATTARLNATVRSSGLDTTYYFEYGTTTNYGNATPAGPVAAGAFATNVSSDIGGLSVLTTYHFRAVVSNTTAVVNGQDLSFTTPRTYTLNPGTLIGSAVWGDYDNDGLLDILRIGTTNGTVSGAVSEIWRNTGDGFTNINAGLPGIFIGSAAWCDFDKNGRLDILLAGYCNSCGSTICQIWRNTGGGFTNANAGLPGVYQASVACGDYDNDGLPDVLLSGTANGISSGATSQVWRNTGNGFARVNTSLPGAYRGAVAWGDYDGDGRLDILLSGTTNGDNLGAISQVWRNTDAGFTNVNAGLPGVYFSSAAWGDYDNDGWLDILLAGNSFTGGDVTQIWRNTGAGFTNINAGLPGVYDSVAWGDYDADGWMDVLVAGYFSRDPTTQIWRNNNGSSFSNVNAGLAGVNGSVAWGDANNDGRLDVLLTGEGAGFVRLTEVWLNLLATTNNPPGAPTNLAATSNEFSSLLTWSAASDNETPANGLTYNLRVGTTPGGGDVVSPEAESDGFRLQPTLGNAQLGTSAFLNLQPGIYYWSVQAVDSAFAGGPFATEASFTVPPPKLSIVSVGTNAFISWQPSYPGWTLQESLSLAPIAWSDSSSGELNPVSAHATNSAKFYRLFKP